MVVEVGEVLGKLEDPGESWDHSLVVNDLDQLMRQEAVGQGEHPELMRLLGQHAEFVPVAEFGVRGQDRKQDVEEREHLLDVLDVQL